MDANIDALSAKLRERSLALSNIAVQSDGKVLYQVSDVLMSLWTPLMSLMV